MAAFQVYPHIITGDCLDLLGYQYHVTCINYNAPSYVNILLHFHSQVQTLFVGNFDFTNIIGLYSSLKVREYISRLQLYKHTVFFILSYPRLQLL